MKKINEDKERTRESERQNKRRLVINGTGDGGFHLIWSYQPSIQTGTEMDTLNGLLGPVTALIVEEEQLKRWMIPVIDIALES